MQWCEVEIDLDLATLDLPRSGMETAFRQEEGGGTVRSTCTGLV